MAAAAHQGEMRRPDPLRGRAAALGRERYEVGAATLGRRIRIAARASARPMSGSQPNTRIQIARSAANLKNTERAAIAFANVTDGSQAPLGVVGTVTIGAIDIVIVEKSVRFLISLSWP